MTPGKVLDDGKDQSVARKAKRDHEQYSEKHQSPDRHVDDDAADLEAVAQHLENELDQDGTDRGSDEALDATDHGHRHHQRHLQQEEVVRGDDADVVGLNGAGVSRFDILGEINRAVGR